MRGSTYFLRDCPTCGRKVQIRVEYLGRRVACRHCRAVFEATDPMLETIKPSDSTIMERAEQLLARVHDEALSTSWLAGEAQSE